MKMGLPIRLVLQLCLHCYGKDSELEMPNYNPQQQKWATDEAAGPYLTERFTCGVCITQTCSGRFRQVLQHRVWYTPRSSRLATILAVHVFVHFSRQWRHFSLLLTE